MGGLSANKPVLPLLTGPMMPGSHSGRRIGACTDCRNNWALYRAGAMDVEEIMSINDELAPTVGVYLRRDTRRWLTLARSERAALWVRRVRWPP